MSNPLFKSIRRAGVPICAIETADPAQTIADVVKQLNGSLDKLTLVQWDIAATLTPVLIAGKETPNGMKFAKKCNPNGMECANPVECLNIVGREAEKGTILFFHNAHRFLENIDVAQAVWNLRDRFKAQKCTLVFLAPALTLPQELKHDAVIISEPLPDEIALGAIVEGVMKDAKQGFADLPDLAPDDRARAIDILRGLSAFAAEQVVAMSLLKTGLDFEGLWMRKKKMIEQTPGLKVWRGGESFADLGGLSNLKRFLTQVLTSGNTPVRAIGFIDEVEKGMAGSAGDTSGTSQDQLQVFLTVMQDLDIPGIILIGPPGTGKSNIAKAAGTVAQCPVIAIDTGAMKGSLVGQSEGRIRAAMEVFKSVSQGKGLFIATCNKIASLPPELRRRFALGTFFVDLPDAEERKAIWPVWLKRYGIKDTALPDCNEWTGAEIKACCDVAFRTGLSLKEAAAFVVPVAVSAPDQVSALRNMAKGRFISANHAGLYGSDVSTNKAQSTGRSFEE